MNKILRSVNKSVISEYCRGFSVSAVNNARHSCKLLVIGGGTGGCVVANKFTRRLNKDEVIVLEPCSDHYYQPLWTLVGAGVTSVENTRRDLSEVLSSKAKWLQDAAKSILPEQNLVTTICGDEICYDYLVVAVGLNIDYNKLPGLKEALEDEYSSVSTIYSPKYCEKTFQDLKKFTCGDILFTYPDTAIKCPGAPQKIAYMVDAYLRKVDRRSNANLTFNTALGSMFGVKKYCQSLEKVVAKKHINVNYTTVLKSIDHMRKEAVFAKMEGTKAVSEYQVPYSMLHVAPPHSTPEFLSKSRHITDAGGYLDVNKFSLQHVKYPNIFGIGDCTNTPNSKTGAAIAVQSYALERNLLEVMAHKCPSHLYNGYGACPLVTSYGTCIMAEFLYDGIVHETFPWDQSKESRIAYQMKRHLFPFIYWNFMLKGYYHGPEAIRRIINPMGW